MQVSVDFSTKKCVRCSFERPLSDFLWRRSHINRPTKGYDNYCRGCDTARRRLWDHRHRPESQPSGDAIHNRVRDPALQIVRTRSRNSGSERCPAGPSASHLYVFSYDFDPVGEDHGFKIGKSVDVATRKRTLEGQHPFCLITHAIFPGKGALETTVHAILDSRRNTKNRAREWFYVSLGEIHEAVLEAEARRAQASQAAEEVELHAAQASP